MQTFTISGTSGDDTLLGTSGDDVIGGFEGNDFIDAKAGNDYINPGNNLGGSLGFDVVRPGLGSNTIDLSDMLTGFVAIDYIDLAGPITADINGSINQATIEKGAAGTDTVIDINNPLSPNEDSEATFLTTSGFRVAGSQSDDVFNVSLENGQWMSVRSFSGDNTFNVSGDGLLRLNYQREGPIVADLSTGTIQHNEFTDTINGTIWEIRASDGADSILGSDADESFILRGGDDTLDGGDGFDLLRYDRVRSSIDGVNADLAAGVATGVWDGTAFTHTISNIEWLRGSVGDDVLVGDGSDNRLEGLSGNDTLDGGLGIDTAVYFGNQSSHTLTLSPDTTTISDRRPDGTGTDTLIDMELLDFDTDLLDGPFDLTKFGGTTGLSEENFESFIELYIAYFNRAPDAVGLNFWGTAFAQGTSLEEMATLFIDQEETEAAYPSGTTNDTFATTVYNNVLGRTPDQDGFDFWVGQLDSGNVSRDQFILEVLRGVQPGSPDRSYLDDKVDIGAYFAVHKGMSDTDNAAAVMELFDDAGVSAAVGATDDYYAEALDPNNGEFLMQVVGVLDDPFAVA